MELDAGDIEMARAQASSEEPRWEGDTDFLIEKLRVCKSLVCGVIEASADCYERTVRELLTWGKSKKFSPNTDISAKLN